VRRYRVGLLAAVSAAASVLAGDVHGWMARALLTLAAALAAGLVAIAAEPSLKKNGLELC
jgi:hypothetical protein